MQHNTLQPGLLALLTLTLGGCAALQPKQDSLLLGISPKAARTTASELITSGGFCVTLGEQGSLLTQECDKGPNQQFDWDAGALQLAQRCLIAKGDDELTLADCQDDSHQWQWQADRLFNRQLSLCLDVAGRRHQPGTPLRLAECYGGANQSFEWKQEGSLLDSLALPKLAW